MNPQDILAKAGELIGVRRAFGDPIPVGDGVLVPAATVMGGGGGGVGSRGTDAGTENGTGGGGGLRVVPVGAYHLRSDGTATWLPAVNVNHIVLAGNAVLALAILVLARRRRGPARGFGRRCSRGCCGR